MLIALEKKSEQGATIAPPSLRLPAMSAILLFPTRRSSDLCCRELRGQARRHPVWRSRVLTRVDPRRHAYRARGEERARSGVDTSLARAAGDVVVSKF